MTYVPRVTPLGKKQIAFGGNFVAIGTMQLDHLAMGPGMKDSDETRPENRIARVKYLTPNVALSWVELNQQFGEDLAQFNLWLCE